MNGKNSVGDIKTVTFSLKTRYRFTGPQFFYVGIFNMDPLFEFSVVRNQSNKKMQKNFEKDRVPV